MPWGKTSKTVDFFLVGSLFETLCIRQKKKKKFYHLSALSFLHVSKKTTLQSNNFTKSSYNLLWDPFGKTSINLHNEDASGNVMQVCGSPGIWAGVTPTGVSPSPEPSDLKAKSPS